MKKNLYADGYQQALIDIAAKLIDDGERGVQAWLLSNLADPKPVKDYLRSNGKEEKPRYVIEPSVDSTWFMVVDTMAGTACAAQVFDGTITECERFVRDHS